MTLINVRACNNRTAHVVFLLTLFLFAWSANAQSEFAPGEEFIEEIVLRDLPISTAIAFAPGGAKAYLALKVGVIRVVQDGRLLTKPFVDLQSIVNKATDRGLLGLAVDPDFPAKPFLYISYVYDPPGFPQDAHDSRVIRVARLTADAAKNYNEMLPDSLEVIVGKQSIGEKIAPPIPLGDPNIPERASCMTGLTMDGAPIEDCIPCDSTSHTAGTLIFGPNRTLFASFGDGASYSGPNRVGLRTQSLDSISGRVLRFNPDTLEGLPDNPWFDATKPNSNRSRTWAYGFRNPFRITLKPANGDAYIGDVGTSYYEEINVGKGMNFGWPCYEGGFSDRNQVDGEATLSTQQVGYRAHPRTVDFCDQMYQLGQSAVRKPLYTYRHPYDDQGRDLGASITGLAFYSGSQYPEKYRGALFFADYARLFIQYLTFDSTGRPTKHDFAKEVGSNLGAVELLSGPDSNIYAVYLDLVTRSSQVRRFRAITSGNDAPVVRASVSPQSGDTPLVVSASASNSFDPDGQALLFAWDFGDGTSSSQADAEHVYANPGTYTVKITVTEATSPFASSSDQFTVRVGSEKPIAKILEPAEGTTYRIGTPMRFSGTSDGTAGDPPQLSWSVIQIHNQHSHLVSEFDGAIGSFTPTEHSDNTAYQLCLIATSGDGLSDQTCVRLPPQTTPYVFNSKPAGATLSYLDEELDVVAPYVARPIVGSEQTIRAAKLHAGRSFVGWSDGNASAVRSFVTKPSPETLTAVYENKPPKAVLALGAGGTARRKRRSVVLDAGLSTDPEGETLRFVWRFSDKSRRTGPTVKKSFSSDGRYTVRLQVSDPLGANTLLKRTLIVNGPRGIRMRAP
jgi:glucose/arabinose dehydrogenase